MKQRNRLTLLLGMYGLLFVCPLSAQRLNFQYYDTSKGLPQSQVYAIHQDRSGYLWVGTLSGAARFNGREWVVYTKANGLPRNQINAIDQDAKGRILLGTYGSGLSIFDGVTFTNFPESELLGKCEVTDLLVENGERIWVASREGLVLLEGDVRRRFESDDGLTDTLCLSLFQSKEYGILVGTRGGLFRYEGGRFQRMDFENSPQRFEISTMIESNNGKLLLGTSSGLFQVADSRLLPISLDLAEESQDFTSSALDQNGTLWLTTRNAGIVRIENGIPSTINGLNGLSNSRVQAVYVDRENNRWFGTDDGLDKLAEGPFVAFTKDHGLVDDFVRTIFQDREGLLWFGTRAGISVRELGQFRTPFPMKLLKSSVIYSIGQHPDGRILIGTYEGLSIYDKQKGTVENHSNGNGLPMRTVRKIYVDAAGQVWLGGDGFCRYTDTGFVRMDADPIVKNSLILDMVMDRRKRLWIATRNQGLLMLTSYDKPVVQYKDPFADAIWTLQVDTGDTLWVGTNGLGLYRRDEEKGFLRFEENGGLTDDFIWQILLASDGGMWIGHNKGIDRIRDGLIQNFNKSDGLADNEAAATAAFEDSEHNLWFGTGLGLTQYTPARVPAALPPPTIHVERVEFDRGGSYHPLEGQNRGLKRNENKLRFTFVGISFRNEREVRYRYKLEGTGEDWSAETADNSVIYNNLGKGEYRFVVKARIQEQGWSEQAEFTFLILPAVYETWWFRVLVLLIIAGMIGGFHRSRVLRVKRRNMVLENMVLERTRELAEKNEELRQLSLSDTLTKLRNRRFLTEMIPYEIETARRSARAMDVPPDQIPALGFLMVDMDHFKSVNDTYGHEAGDKLLEQVSSLFTEVVRSSDVVARWGGEEFLIFLKTLKPQMVGTMAQRILEAVRALEFQIGEGRTIRRTCSIGYSFFPLDLDPREVSWEDVVKLSDMALYMAKRSGRDRVVGLSINPAAKVESLGLWFKGDLEKGLKNGIFQEIHSEE